VVSLGLVSVLAELFPQEASVMPIAAMRTIFFIIGLFIPRFNDQWLCSRDAFLHASNFLAMQNYWLDAANYIGCSSI